MIFEDDFDGVSEEIIRREKAKARDLRKGRWWQQKIGQGTCYYCNKNFKPKALTMDHIIPLARGGTSSKNNIAPCCKECNTKKNILLPTEWEEYMNRLSKDEG